MNLLKEAYKPDNYLNFLAGKFNFSKNLAPISIENNEVKSFEKLGTVTTHDDKQLPIFEIHIKPNTKLSRNRVQLRNLVAKQIQTEDGALAVYVDEPNHQWRFSFIAIEYSFSDEGLRKEQTASKRFTYLLGENTNTKTAGKRFEKLDKQSTLEDLKTAFSVEALNKEFYDKLYCWYEKAQDQVVFPNDEKMENHTETSLIRLLTRLLFIWFIKEKKLINADLFDKNKLPTLIDYEKPSSFYKAILQNLFFATLNRPIVERSFRNTTNGAANSTNYLVTNIYRYQGYFTDSDEDKIIALFAWTPFLNGGLFECLDREASKKEKQAYDNDKTIRPVGSAIRIDGFSDRADNELTFDNILFFNDDETGLIDLFNQYQFTVEESTPLDIEVALDPELLGKVFENLLASYNPETGQQARKATGSFYTPREIVNYMVDESLKQHFHQHTDLTDEQINALFVDAELTEQENALNKQQTKALIYAIDGLKILDPAVGSGAYPMGILQRLVLILEKVDAENTHFKQQQIDKAEQIPDKISCASAIAAIEQVFSQQNQHNAYGKKLMLIENCIYGVDIQPIAIQICKLRFFISLTIEQTRNQDKADNYGIQALPNLETRFIVANSLLFLDEMPKLKKGLFNDKIIKLQKRLAEIRHKHFSAKTLETKRKCRTQDKYLRQQMLDELRNNEGITPEIIASMKKIVHWNPYNQNAIADWFDPEWMFGIKDGFDIVIGNPPYIMEDDNKEAFNNLHNHPCYEGKADIWHLFTGSGLNFTTEKGVLIYIAKNQWFCSSSASKMRKIIYKQSHLKKIIDFGVNMIFENADQQTMIVLLQKDSQNTKHDIDYIKFGSKFLIKEIKKILQNPKERKGVLISHKKIPKFYNEKDNLTFSSSKNEIILNKIDDKENFKFDGKKEIIQGIIGGPDKAFIVKSNELRKFNSKEKNYLKMFHTNTQRYSTVDTEKYILYLSNKNFYDKNIDDHPNIKDFFTPYKIDLLKKKVMYKTPNKPYFYLHRERDERFFKEGPKIVWAKRTEGRKFTYTKKSLYGTANLFFIKSVRVNLKYITAILNSQLMYFYMNERLKHTGDLLQLDKNQFMKIPLHRTSKNEQQPFIELVDKILTAKEQGRDTRTLETQIDQMVYQLYNLSDEEVRIVEGGK